MIPSSVTSIEVSAFAECSSLESVKFLDVNGWCASSYLDEDNIIHLDLLDSLQNAVYLKSTYSEYDWSKEEVKTYNVNIMIGGTNYTVTASEGTNLASLLALYDLTEENTAGFYLDGGDSYIDIDNTEITEDISIYTYIATLEKLTIANGAVSAVNDSISGDVVIPKKSGGELVTTIDTRAFGYCVGITSVVMPSSITSIGVEAFYGCSNLRGVHMSSNLTDICSGAFSECSSLGSIWIPDSVTYMGASAFSGCSSLISVNIPSSIRYVEDSTFYNCTSLTNVTLGSGLWLGNYAFYGCTNLETIEGDDIAGIGDSTFAGCIGLSSFTISSSVAGIGWGAFLGCDNLTSVTFEDPYDWYISEDMEGSSGVNLVLTNEGINATYLKSTYWSYYWHKEQ
jgi:hypothetical protein